MCLAQSHRYKDTRVYTLAIFTGGRAGRSAMAGEFARLACALAV